VSQRIKEGADDYRYFPDPDLPEMMVHGTGGIFDLENIKKEIGELPNVRKERIMNLYGLTSIKAILFVINSAVFEYFENTVFEIKNILKDSKNLQKAYELIYNYLVTDILGYVGLKNIKFSDIKISVINFAKLINLIIDNRISSRGAKDILEKIIENDNDPETIMKENGLEQVSNSDDLLKIVLEVLSENEKSVLEYKSGKVTVIQFLIGKTMAKAKGSGNPGMIKELIEKELNI
jgi:aspartyl-tRNA(Asn)/glutamyl-tRNA(Gln) amidotransferase subunit B